MESTDSVGALGSGAGDEGRRRPCAVRAVRNPLLSPVARGAAVHAAPWAISLLAHAAVAAVLTCVFVLMADGEADDVIVPDARFSETPGRPLVAAVEPATLEPEPAIPPVEASVVHTAEAPVLADMDESTDVELAGLTTPASPGGDLSAFSLDAASATAVSRFFGDGGSAHHIVYVVDCSGSMYSTLGTPNSPGPVRMEMLRSISELSPRQDFHVIFFAAGRPRECPPYRLVPATDEAKLRAARFMKTIRPDVQTDPLPALRRAFEVLSRADRGRKGKVIYLLTDGEDFPDRRKLTAALAKLNAAGEVRINTILYDHRPTAAVGDSPLRRIAQTCGGWFKHVVENE